MRIMAQGLIPVMNGRPFSGFGMESYFSRCFKKAALIESVNSIQSFSLDSAYVT